ncbi:MAG: phenylalanine--tRNA ligase subunit beta [Patescibacteria group bacterium]
MKILKSWLKDYIDIKLTDSEMAEKLNISGTEVESVTSFLDSNVVIAEIKDIKKHPNADRLRIATVFDGKSDLTVVCGAPNIEVGQKVPLAKLGAKLGDIEIKKTEIRGVESEGMICAEDELGLGNDHAGIIVLPNEYKIGKPLSEYVESDAVFELEITPNRGDCLSHIGIAREIAALTGRSISKTPISLDMNSANIKDRLSIKITDKKLCPQYMARLIEGIKVGPSPDWLKKRLELLGLKPINNIVDVTNFVMYDLGQPLHAFDADKIDGKEIIVRKNKPNEKVKTLDGVERIIKDAILITDKNKAIAIAGVMGGNNSEISEETTRVVIESAEFNRKNIRKTAKELGLVTEASYRFERGINSGSVEYALNKAAKMMQELAGGRIISGIAKEEEKAPNKTLEIEYEKINNLTGLDLSVSEINRILNSLGFEVKNDLCIVPFWRHDIEIWQDLAEEVARIYGYNKITPLALQEVKAPKKSTYYYKEMVKDALAEEGFVEAINYPYLSEDGIKAANLKTKDLLEIANPIQPENKYLRNSLVPGLLKSIAKNPSFDLILFFEVGKVFSRKNENNNLAIVSAGKNAKNEIEKVIENICVRFKIDKKYFNIKELTTNELQKFKIKKPVVYKSELNLDNLISLIKVSGEDLELKLNQKRINYRPVSKFPAITRDLAFIVDKKIESSAVEETITEISELIARVELFDEFTSDKFGVNKKNIAFHIYLQHPERTMIDKEADDIIKSVIKNIEGKFKASLRK